MGKTITYKKGSNSIEFNFTNKVKKVIFLKTVNTDFANGNVVNLASGVKRLI
jgi:hypothetical protein